MKYFTTDTHFGHPLVSVLRGFTTFDPGHTQYDALLSSQGRKAAEDWAKGVVLDDSRLNFRKAADTDAHDEAIVANINRIVGEDDELWILGDIGYRTSVRHLKSCLRQLRCRHLHAVIGNHDDWWLDDAPARDLFESIEPNSTAELTGLGIGRPQATETVNLSHSPTVRILPMAGRMMPYVSAIRHCRSTDIVCCMVTRTSCLRRAHATKPSTLDWTHGICNR